jgi:hypothetical protein
MRRKLLLLFLAVLFVGMVGGCGKKPDELRAQVTVFLSLSESAEHPKPAADHKVYILEYDLVDQLNMVAGKTKNEMKLGELEESVRQEIGYYEKEKVFDDRIEKALVDLDKKVSYSKSRLALMQQKEQALVSKVKNSFTNYINQAYPAPAVRREKLSQLRGKNDWDGVYFFYLDESRKSSSLSGSAKTAFENLKKVFDSSSREYGPIKREIVENTRVVKTLPPEVYKKVDRWQGEIDKLKQQVAKIVEQRRGDVYSEVIDHVVDFFLTDETKIELTTDGSGKAMVSMPLSEYWAAALVKIDDKELIWNVPFKAKRDKELVKLNPANVSRLTSPELKGYVIRSLTAAMEGEKPKGTPAPPGEQPEGGSE